MRRNLAAWRAVVTINPHAKLGERPSIIYTLTVRCPLCTSQHDMKSPKWSLLEQLQPTRSDHQAKRLLYSVRVKRKGHPKTLGFVVRSSFGEWRSFARQSTTCPHCGIHFGLTQRDHDDLQRELRQITPEWVEAEIVRREHEANNHDVNPSDYGWRYGMISGPPKELVSGT